MSQIEKLLKTDVKEKLLAAGFEAQTPPEFTAQKTVIVKGVDSYIASFSEAELKDMIRTSTTPSKVVKVIKIPNVTRLMKVIFQDATSANDAVKKGLQWRQ